MDIPKKLLEINTFDGPGYKRGIEYERWTVAWLNYIDELEPQNIKWIQKHNKTDESFILLSGKCILYLFEGKDRPEKMHALDMEPFKIYNVKEAVWHTHTLTKDGKVLIVENQNTKLLNSPRVRATAENHKEFVEACEKFWKPKTAKKKK